MKPKIILTALFLYITGSAFAQGQAPDLSHLNHDDPSPFTTATVVAQANGSIASAGLGQAAVFQSRALTLHVTLGSTQGLDKIAVLVGSSPGSSDIFYKEFDYGGQGDFGDGSSYHANGNSLTLGLGSYAGAPVYYAEVFGIMNDGKRSKGKRVTIE